MSTGMLVPANLPSGVQCTWELRTAGFLFFPFCFLSYHNDLKKWRPELPKSLKKPQLLVIEKGREKSQGTLLFFPIPGNSTRITQFMFVFSSKNHSSLADKRTNNEESKPVPPRAHLIPNKRAIFILCTLLYNSWANTNSTGINRVSVYSCKITFHNAKFRTRVSHVSKITLWGPRIIESKPSVELKKYNAGKRLKLPIMNCSNKNILENSPDKALGPGTSITDLADLFLW